MRRRGSRTELLRRRHPYFLRAEGAAPGTDRDLTQAVRALAGRLVDRRLGAPARHERVHRLHDEEEDDRGDDDERDQRIEERAVEKVALGDRESEVAEARL